MHVHYLLEEKGGDEVTELVTEWLMDICSIGQPCGLCHGNSKSKNILRLYNVFNLSREKSSTMKFIHWWKDKKGILSIKCI